MTQEDRFQIVARALWFSAIRYEPKEGKLLAHIDVDDAAHTVLGILDDLELLVKLPISSS